jgi:hypothetical protein
MRTISPKVKIDITISKWVGNMMLFLISFFHARRTTIWKMHTEFGDPQHDGHK